MLKMLTQQQRNNRRKRASPKQLAFLREKFLEDPKPDQAKREAIGRIIDMTPRSVQIWFQNNRAKTKIQEQRLSLLYPTLSSELGGNRSRIYIDTDSMIPNNSVYDCDDYAVSMPSLSETPLLSNPNNSSSYLQPLKNNSFLDIPDLNLDSSHLPRKRDGLWENSSFYTQNNGSRQNFAISSDDLLLDPGSHIMSPSVDDLFDDIEEEVDFNSAEEWLNRNNRRFMEYHPSDDNPGYASRRSLYNGRFSGACRDGIFGREPLAMGFYSSDDLSSHISPNNVIRQEDRSNFTNRFGSEQDVTLSIDPSVRPEICVTSDESPIIEESPRDSDDYNSISQDFTSEGTSSGAEAMSTAPSSTLTYTVEPVLETVPNSSTIEYLGILNAIEPMSLKNGGIGETEENNMNDGTFVVIPCYRMETFENIEIFSETISDCIELEYSPLLEKMRIYIDPTCFPGERDDIIRVMETNVREVLDYSKFHLHIRTDGFASFYTVNKADGSLVPLDDLHSKGEFLLSTEYSIYGNFNDLTNNDIFKCTSKVNVQSSVCASNRLSYDLKKILDPEHRLLV